MSMREAIADVARRHKTTVGKAITVTVLVLLGWAGVCAIAGAVLYVVIHFIVKFW